MAAPLPRTVSIKVKALLSHGGIRIPWLLMAVPGGRTTETWLLIYKQHIRTSFLGYRVQSPAAPAQSFRVINQTESFPE
ncbi:uncharacterized protein BDV14DRAFT_176417 [Aspergillus stella-maris]|uniref:uncharacterized protein n=1 Tax=Aspergillus stella-maris TaxID=1810926 RepID=UPI003CCE327C